MHKAAIVFLILSVGGGCEEIVAQCFRVLDANDGQPIAGVRAVGRFGMWQPAMPGIFPVYVQMAATGVSDVTGLIQLESGVNLADFNKEGYEPCGIEADWPGYRRRPRCLHWNAFPWEDEYTATIYLRPAKGTAERHPGDHNAVHGAADDRQGGVKTMPP